MREVETVMRRSAFLWTFVLCAVLTAQSRMAFAQRPTIIGTWTGTAAQNEGKSNYTVVMTITSTGADTNYPELNCGGKLKRVGSANGSCSTWRPSPEAERTAAARALMER